MVRNTRPMEKQGINHVRNIVETEMECIFREKTDDIGIDAEIELMENGEPTGHIFLLQVKSGESYIQSIHEKGFLLYPKRKHLERCKKYYDPIILVIYSPKRKKAYWKYFIPSIEENMIHFNWEDVFTKNIKEFLIKIYEKSSVWFKYQEEKHELSDVDIKVLNERFQCISEFSKILVDEYLRRRKKTSNHIILGIVRRLNETFNFRNIKFNFIGSGENKIQEQFVFSEGKGEGIINIHAYIFHFYKKKLSALLQFESWYQVFLTLIGRRTEVEFIYYDGEIFPNEINLFGGRPIYKIELTKARFRCNGKLKIYMISDSIPMLFSGSTKIKDISTYLETDPFWKSRLRSESERYLLLREISRK